MSATTTVERTVSSEVDEWLQHAPPLVRKRLGGFLAEVGGRSDVVVDHVADKRTETSGVLVRFGSSDLPDGTFNVLARAYYVYLEDERTTVERMTSTTRAVSSLTELVVFGRSWVATAPDALCAALPEPRAADHDVIERRTVAV